MKKGLSIAAAMVFALSVAGQVGINKDNTAPDPSAMLDVKSSDKGILPPRMTTAQRNNILSPAAGLYIFNTDCNDMQYFNGTSWVPMGNTGSLATPGSITGNPTPCLNETGGPYSISPVPSATGYQWIVPSGAVITTGQGTTSVIVDFGTTSGVICVAAVNDCYRSEMSCLGITLQNPVQVSVDINASANPVCEGTYVTFTATGNNGGYTPSFQWKSNNTDIPGATASTCNLIPANNDIITCVMTSSLGCVSGDPATSNAITMTVIPLQPVGISIVPSANPVCTSSSVTFTATPVNGGTNPMYSWFVNGVVTGATNPTYSFTPQTGDIVSCKLYSNAVCASGSPATSNSVVMTVSPYLTVSVSITASANPACNLQPVTFTAAPVNGGSGPAYQWKKNGNIITGATNQTYTYSPLLNDAIVCQMTSNYECPLGNPATSNTITMSIQSAVTANHVAGAWSPYSTVITYGITSNITGEETKCWITKNLGASQQAASVWEILQASAGWYWQFNKTQGYSWNGSTRTPNTTWITSINQNSQWLQANDPCTHDLGTPWRIPTFSEWNNVNTAGGWTDWNGPWNSTLKLHAAGGINYLSGTVVGWGTFGNFWSSNQYNNYDAWLYTMDSNLSITGYSSKAGGCSLRCIK